MLIIGVVNPKGGSGKSTTTISLCGGFQESGLTVALVETDPQGTLREWAAEGKKYKEENGTDWNIPEVIDTRNKAATADIRNHPDLHGKDVDVLLIDGVANDFSQVLGVAKAADLILMVTQPDPSDLKPIDDVIDALVGKNVTAAFLLCRTGPNDMTGEVKRMLSDYPYKVLSSTIREHKGARKVKAVGATVYDYPSYHLARKDINEVIEELWSEFNLGEKV